MADPAFEAAGIVWDAEEELSVNPLRQLMLEELRRRNFADTTVRTYLHGVAHFSQYFHRPPDQLGPEEIRKYQAALFTTVEVQPEHCNPAAGGSAFLLHSRIEARLEHRRDALSEEGASPSSGTQPGRSRATD